MTVSRRVLDESDLPNLKPILIPPCKTSQAMHESIQPTSLRRSPRKQVAFAPLADNGCNISDIITLTATSNQRRQCPSPRKSPCKQRSPLKTVPQARTITPRLVDEEMPVLSSKNITLHNAPHVSLLAPNNPRVGAPELKDVASLLLPLSNLNMQRQRAGRIDHSSDLESETSQQQLKFGSKKGRGTTGKSIMSLMTDAARNPPVKRSSPRKMTSKQQPPPKYASRFVLQEARCNDDDESSIIEEEEDTDLSGFIVDDDAELSYHGSSSEHDREDSEAEKVTRKKVVQPAPRKRLQRGRRKAIDSDDEDNSSLRHGSAENALTDAFKSMELEESSKEHTRRRNIDVVDLTSSPPQSEIQHTLRDTLLPPSQNNQNAVANLFDNFKNLRLSPPRQSVKLDMPSKLDPFMSSSDHEHQDPVEEERQEDHRFTTPPATPPRSPTKLKSPSKLLSPSKRNDQSHRSPHRQSMDAFWDLNEVNEWNDQYSPKKAPTASPRKNLLARFNLWSDEEDNNNNDDTPSEEDKSFGGSSQSSEDSLPSPCASPSKNRFRSPAKPGIVSSEKREKQRLLAEKRAKAAEKALFESRREQLAQDLLTALDKNITKSRLGQLAASTGGVQIIWSKTLRSTAGRANWRRTATKITTGSPVKDLKVEKGPGVIYHHHASIELAIKVIDREDRLVSTLAHEFCHLANFMISGIRDNPHGKEFQQWAAKVTKWMKHESDVTAWQNVEVTTKHGYVIEHKYLWICTGRKKLDQQRLKMREYLNIDDDEEDEGCGAEYGRHSKSIDPETARCGRCKGLLLQVRPTPRAAVKSPAKKTITTTATTTTATKRITRGEAKMTPSSGGSSFVSGIDKLSTMVEVVELSD